jgi:hypothetical protein
MDLFKRDLTILYQKDDENKHSYGILLMYCEIYEKSIDTDIINNKAFIKGLYEKFHFGGVQRDKDEMLEYVNFIESFYMLIDIINAFYKLAVSNTMNIIQENIATITKNTEKPFKTGLIDFLSYIKLYIYIFEIHLGSDILIIIQNKKFFKILLEYEKDITNIYNSSEYPECILEIKEHLKEYTSNSKSLLWMIQQIIATHPEHSKCAFNMMKNLFNSYIATVNPDLQRVLTHIFTININERYSRIFTVFLELFFKQYPDIDIEDIALNECKAKESQIVLCPNNVNFRICDETAKEITDNNYNVSDICLK